MTAVICECLAVREALACCDQGDWFRASVWLRLADEANAEWVAA